jgi:hypothetical protein
MIERDYCAIGHDVARNPTLYRYCLKRLSVLTSVYQWTPPIVGAESDKQVPHSVDRIRSHPRPSGVRSGPDKGDFRLEDALAAGLDPRAGRLAEYRGVPA